MRWELLMVRVLATFVFFAAVAVYAAPSVIAVLRARRRWPLAVAVNILLGWTILGWLAALAMALGLRLPRREKRNKPRARRAAPPAPAATQVVAPEAGDAAPVREPPKLPDESYARWLDKGSAMTA